MTRNKHLIRIVSFVILAILVAACVGQAAPAAGDKQTYSDPFKYCTAVGTIDKPDARYTGLAVPESVTTALKKSAGLSAELPNEVLARGTTWRCMDKEVWACFVGANLPCGERADASDQPKQALVDFCKTNPNAENIPAAVTGRATLFTWSCANGVAKTVKQVFKADKQGFIADFWYKLSK
jgi:hypothetical protein